MQQNKNNQLLESHRIQIKNLIKILKKNNLQQELLLKIQHQQELLLDKFQQNERGERVKELNTNLPPLPHSASVSINIIPITEEVLKKAIQDMKNKKKI